MNMGIVSVHAWPRLGKGTDAACPHVMLLASQMEWGLNLGGSAVHAHGSWGGAPAAKGTPPSEGIVQSRFLTVTSGQDNEG